MKGQVMFFGQGLEIAAVADDHDRLRIFKFTLAEGLHDRFETMRFPGDKDRATLSSPRFRETHFDFHFEGLA
jgi:hypothetical protein